MAVLGYEPTPEELEAIRRGEDPRANEGKEPPPSNAPAANGRPRRPPDNRAVPDDATPAETGPASCVILRWLDSATVSVEAEGRREVVALAGLSAQEDAASEERALSDRMNRWTYGTAARLRYPLKDAKGQVVYRDTEGRLLAALD